MLVHDNRKEKEMRREDIRRLRAERKEDMRRLRAEDMQRLREQGWSLDRIGDKYNISHERVRQLIGPGNCYDARRRLAEPIIVSLYQNSQLAYGRIAKEMEMSSSTVKRILREAGIEAQPRYRPRMWTNERIIEAIQLWVERHGTPPTSRDWLKGRGRDGGAFTDEFPYVSIVQRRFGSFNAGIRAAGFAPLAAGGGRRLMWTNERIIEAIQLWAERYGSPPTAREWAFARETDPRFTHEFPHTSILLRNFGSFNNAIQAAGFAPLEPGQRNTQSRSHSYASH